MPTNKSIPRAWILSFAMAGVLAFIGFRANPKMWGFYIQLPGIAAGLFAGFAAASRSAILTKALVTGTTIVLNAVCYCYAYRFFVWMSSGKANARRREPL